MIVVGAESREFDDFGEFVGVVVGGGGGGSGNRGIRRVVEEIRVHMGGLGGGGLNVARGEGNRAGKGVSEFREVENGGITFDGQGSNVVGSSGHFRGGESPEPNAGFLAWLADFGHPFAPSAHSYAAVHWVLAGISMKALVGFGLIVIGRMLGNLRFFLC